MRPLEIRDITTLTKDQLQSIGTYKHDWYSHKYLDNRIKQKYGILKVKEVKNGLMSKDN